jgi:hypothetical protein
MVDIRGFITTSIPEFVLVTIPAKLHGARELAVTTFMNATPLQQKATIAALAILALALLVGIGTCIWNAYQKSKEQDSFLMLDFSSVHGNGSVGEHH